uniref:Uncharacterized protein n=1 Tax=Anguilla anguilla TaxID=7936 RepID=A0A0E9PBW4_ANGAN
MSQAFTVLQLQMNSSMEDQSKTSKGHGRFPPSHFFYCNK